MTVDSSSLELPQANGHANGHPLGRSVHKMPSNAVLGLDDEEEMTFDSPQEEAAYYRDRCRRMEDMLLETRAELDEFQASSKELEDELEKELAATEKQQQDLKERIQRLEAEKEEWKNKYLNLQKMHSSNVAAMQREMDNLRSERDKTLVALRDLEMGNDELERNERVAVSSLLDLESKYNRAIEEKTLLEQEIVLKQEVEEECQRLKDDVRDANNEISILRDQIARAAAMPSASDSMQISPPRGSRRSLSHVEVSPMPSSPATPYAPSPSGGASLRQTGLSRSNTLSSIPTPSPLAAKRMSQIPASPSGLPSLSRSTTSRNLAGANMPSLRDFTAGLPPGSPGLTRSRTGWTLSSAGPTANAGRPQMNANLVAKTKGFKLLHDLQARLKATDDKLVSKMPKRNVSNPLAQARRAVSGASASTAASAAEQQPPPVPVNPRLNALNRAEFSTPGAGQVAGQADTPNSWIMVSDNEGQVDPSPAEVGQQPAAAAQGTFPRHQRDPVSPLDRVAFRAVSSASTATSRGLPSRPGIPSPLASVTGHMQRATSVAVPSRSAAESAQPAASSALRTSTMRPTGTTAQPDWHPSRHALAQSTRAPSRNAPSRTGDRSHQDRYDADAAAPRPPSRSHHLGQSGRSRTPAPAGITSPTKGHHHAPGGNALSASTSRAPGPRPVSRTERPISRTEHRSSAARQHTALGRGHPPSGPAMTAGAGATPPATSASSASAALKRSARRSSLGPQAEAHLPPTQIPGPRTPARPASVSFFGNTPPPPVPRIPSVHKREAEKRQSRDVLREAGQP